MTDENGKKKIFTVLCIDGGGVRGVVAARILAELEKRTGKPIAELFDMVAGTSTGSIIGACLLAPDPKDPTKPRYTAQETLDFYFTLAEKVFPEIRFKTIRKLAAGGMYDPKPLEEALLANFGDLKLKDVLLSFFVPAADIKHFKPVWMTHRDGQKDTSAEGWDSMLLRDAVRAATSAPTYFPVRYVETTPNPETPNVKHRHALVDGGVFASHAMQHALNEARKVAPPDAEIVLVHVGNGNPGNGLSPEEFNNLSPLGMVSAAHGNVLTSLMLKMAMLDCEADMQDELGANLFTFDRSIPLHGGPDNPSMELDDSRPENLKNLAKHADKIIAENNEAFDRMCEMLLSRQPAADLRRDSREAVRLLTEKMAEIAAIHTLKKTFFKIVHYSLGIEEADPSTEDLAIKALVDRVAKEDLALLGQNYRELLVRKESENRLINGIKQVGQEITKIFKGPEPPIDPPSNDNDNPADDRQFPKRGNDKPNGP